MLRKRLGAITLDEWIVMSEFKTQGCVWHSILGQLRGLKNAGTEHHRRGLLQVLLSRPDIIWIDEVTDAQRPTVHVTGPSPTLYQTVTGMSVRHVCVDA